MASRPDAQLPVPTEAGGLLSWGSSRVPLAAAHDVALCDLDGVIYVGQAAVPHAAEVLAVAGDRYGMRAGFVTNNAARTPAAVSGHLRELGIPAQDADVVTSAQAGVRVLSEMLPEGARVLYIGGDGVPTALVERGFVPVDSIDDEPVALIQGYGREVGWEQLAHGSYALFRGLPWVATNTDRTIPTPHGKALGNGAMVAALAYATGATPVVAGKPEPPLMLESVERTAAERPLVVGDRLDTDIEGANRSGIASLLVLTGVTAWPELLSAPAEHRPTYISADMRGLLEEHPQVRLRATGSQIVAECGALRAEALVRPAGHAGAGHDVSWARGLGLAEGPEAELDAVRVVVAIAWAAADLGVVISRCALDGRPGGDR